MNRKETVFNYLAQIFLIYGFTVLTLNIFCVLFGESAREFSTIFALGRQGLSVATMFQFFALSVLIATLRFVIFSDGLIRRVSIVIRTIAMFTMVILIMVVFIYLFGWFPIHMWQPWVMFFLCFGISAVVSACLSIWKEKLENQVMEDALERLKAEAGKHE